MDGAAWLDLAGGFAGIGKLQRLAGVPVCGRCHRASKPQRPDGIG